MVEILLIHTPFRDFSRTRLNPLNNGSFEVEHPIGLCYIAAVLEQHGFNARILDMEAMKATPDDFLRVVRRLRPRIVGFSCTTVAIEVGLDLAKKTKDHDPTIKTVFGGVHPSLFPLEVIGDPSVDFVVVGEGEYAMLELAEHLLGNQHAIGDIKGLVYKNHDSAVPRICRNADRPVEVNLDKFPFPAKHLILGDVQRKYYSAAAFENPISAIITTRGCPFRCSFCAKFFKVPRFRSPDNVLEEIQMIVEKERIRDLEIRDYTFNLKQAHNIDICKGIIKNQWDIHWRALVRPELLNEELISYYKKSNCYMLSIGAESGSPRILKFLRKGYGVEQITRAFQLADKYEIETSAYFIIGIPGETSADIAQTVKLIRNTKPNYLILQIYQPIPGNDLYDMLVKHNLTPAKHPPYSLFKGFDIPFLNLRNLPNKSLTRIRNLTLLESVLDFKYLVKMGKVIIKNPLRFPRNIETMMKFVET
jgi:anaerobic magnesium-protoporphyrin IX monomethyl ester cyclase